MDEQLDSKEFADAYDSALKRAARVAKENRHDISLAEDAAQEAVLKLKSEQTQRIHVKCPRRLQQTPVWQLHTGGLSAWFHR